VTKKKLKQHGALKREIDLIDKKLDQLYDRQKNIPTVLGKVKGSSPEFPYIETRPTVYMDEPGESDQIKKLIRMKTSRKITAMGAVLEIEEFIAAIPDSTARQIFEMTFLEEKKQQEVADQVGYSRSRISQIISEYLKD
jgi:DNA-directed RNA polymerase specialized sigma24 family protein